MQEELDRKRIVLVAGFQGINKYGDQTTLGRGGSDTTAVALAVALKADLCQIYTDVDGVYTADPRKVKNAHKIDEITFDEMLELASLGAQVLHNRSVEMAKRYNMNVEVLSSFTGAPGTIVKEVVKKVEKTYISGVASDKDVARIALVGLQDQPGVAFKVFNLLAKEKINVDIILQSIGRSDSKDISFTVNKNVADRAYRVLMDHKDSLGYDHVDINQDVAKVSVVGGGMVDNPGVAATMFEALYEAHINIKMISTSEIKVSVLISKDDSDRAVAAIHDKFFG
jgi:aspartate kinase